MEQQHCLRCEQGVSPESALYCPWCGALLIGASLFDRYRVEKLLTTGVTAEIYLAWDESNHQRVVLKVTRRQWHQSENEWERIYRRARREAHYLWQIQHPNVVRFLAAFDLSPGCYALVEEYVQGETLEQVVKQQGLYGAYHRGILAWFS